MFFLSRFLQPSLRLGLVLLLASFASSCIPNKQMVYFPNPEFNTNRLTSIPNEPGDYRLQERDILSVRVKSMDTESSEFFNLSDRDYINLNQASVYLSGYSIDENGNIELPEIGEINVANLTVTQAQKKIKEKIAQYLNNATVIVKLISFKITVLGEVKNPGYYNIYNDQATVLEGLGMAGDLTDFGNRENITLIRQTEGGSAAILIDLKDPKLLSSQFYYLQPNDVIYVQPFKAKTTRSNLSTLSILGLAFSATSTAILILNYMNKP